MAGFKAVIFLSRFNFITQLRPETLACKFPLECVKRVSDFPSVSIACFIAIQIEAKEIKDRDFSTMAGKKPKC